MKELSIEEKAKAFDKVLERAKDFQKVNGAAGSAVISEIFPELVENESKDEQLRKNCIHFLELQKSHHAATFEIEECIAWLEKQGAQNPTADKVEPKFQKGQWIVWLNKCYKVNYNGCGYELIDQTGLRTSLEYGTVDASAHLWTIQDAKDGDVLACGDKASDYPFIFHNLTEELNPRSYCGVNTTHQFQVNDENGGSWCCLDDVRPANKEQQDYLFKKMREAGYEWEGHTKKLICK